MLFRIFIALGIVCLFLQYSEKYKLKSQQNTTTHLLSSVQFSCSVVSDSLRPHESQHARPPCPSPTSIRFAKIQETKKQTINWQYQGPAKVWNNRLNFQIILVGIQNGRVKKTKALSIISKKLFPKCFLEGFSLST